MYELIITEKPAAAKKVAEALATGKPIKENYKKAPYYKITHEKKDIVVTCAVGHLFGLAEKKKAGMKYPVFDIEWKPTSEISKESTFTKDYLESIKKLAKDSKEVTVATDYDVEGEVIGLNVVRYLCKRKDARRMKFSTLTKPDLVNAYDSALSHLDWGQAEAGETRHFLDFFYGINLSRALTSAVKTSGLFQILSTGRVQGPALKIIVDREREIKTFKPVPYWEITLQGSLHKQPIEAIHQTEKFWEKEKAETVMKNVSGAKQGNISNVDVRQFNQAPPTPFDLTTLQTESYRYFGIKPSDTLKIAQELYLGGYISYPRTSSQQLPPSIGYTKILNELKKYTQLAELLLKQKELQPNNGKKTDPAHPALYPTGIIPKELTGRNAKVYDLIVKRFLATFGLPAKRETVKLTIDVNKEPFIASGSRTIEKGWHVYYAPYVSLEEAELPSAKKGDIADIKKINCEQKETQPPKRYTQSSIIRELEKRNLGTKATRSEIVETLYRRNYVMGESIEATDFGIHITQVLEKYSPKIVDEELTRHFEQDMDEIRESKKKKDEVLKEAQNVLTEILHEFKHREKDIGQGLVQTLRETRAAMTTIGSCPVCKTGVLTIRPGKFGRFAACDKYPDCKTTFSLPRSGKVVVGTELCGACKFPMITMIRKAKRPQNVCINMECSTKKIPDNVQEKQCPKCKEGRLVLRKSVYGAFLGCNKYPKCKTIEKIETKD